MASIHRYHICGLTLQSEIELPGVPLAPAASAPEVVIRYGFVPLSLNAPTSRGAAFEATTRLLLAKAPIGRYLVHDGREITIQPNDDADESDVRAFLVGGVFGALLHQRGVLPLHASAIRVGDRCVAFVGNCGAGKSTLAAFLQKHGYPLVTDDICPIQELPQCGPFVQPGFSRFRLWADAMQALEIGPANCPKVRRNLEKYEVPATHRVDEQRLPLDRIYVLHESRDRDFQGIRPIEGPDRLDNLLRHTYRLRYVRKSELRDVHFKTCVDLTNSVGIYQLQRPWNLARLPETVDWLEEHWHDLRQQSRPTNQLCAAA